MRLGDQLPDWKKREIYAGFLADEPKTSISRRVKVDRKTVYKYIDKIKGLPVQSVYALIAPPCGEGHASFKCQVCGRLHDNIKSTEFQEIKRLRQQVKELESKLNQAYATPFHTSPAQPISSPVTYL